MENEIKILSTMSAIVEAPEYIKVLPCGYVSSEKGDFIVDDESFRLMKEYMEKRKIDIVVDYEHHTLENKQAPAGGWIKELFLKPDGIFARVEWTQRARDYLSMKEYRYLSPVVLVRKKDKKAAQLHSVGLTNTPAINGMTPIVNSLKIAVDNKQDEMLEHVLKMCNVSKEDIIKYSNI